MKEKTPGYTMEQRHQKNGVKKKIE